MSAGFRVGDPAVAQLERIRVAAPAALSSGFNAVARQLVLPDYGGYFSPVLTEVKLAATLGPMPWTAALMVTAMPTAMIAYSIAVAADSSAINATKVRIGPYLSGIQT